jgi:hypothetical protein
MTEYANLDDKEWFQKKYVEEGMTVTQIADLIGTEEHCVTYYRKRHGIQIPVLGGDSLSE